MAFRSLQTQLALSFVALIVAITATTFFYTLGETKRALKEMTQSEMRSLAAVVGQQLSGAAADSLAVLKAGDEVTPYYQAIADQLDLIRDHHEDIIYAYTMRREGDAVGFVVDPDFGNPADPGAAIGEIYEGTAGMMERGFIAPTVEKDFATDRWGTVLSAYAPIQNSAGEVIGLVGIDMTSDRVVARQQFLGNTIWVIMAAGIIVAALFILLFAKTIIRDIDRLNHIATTVSTGSMDVHVDVHRGDEIGELADSFRRMVASLKIMMIAGEER